MVHSRAPAPWTPGGTGGPQASPKRPAAAQGHVQVDLEVAAYHRALGTEFVDVSLDQDDVRPRGDQQPQQQAHKTGAQQPQLWRPQASAAAIINAPEPLQADRAVAAASRDGRHAALPVREPVDALDQGPLASAYAAIRYAARLARAVPRWVARKSRPIIHKVATRIAANRRTLGSIAVPQWLRVASRAGSAAQAGGTHHGALKVQGHMGRVGSTLLRFGHSVSRLAGVCRRRQPSLSALPTMEEQV